MQNLALTEDNKIKSSPSQGQTAPLSTGQGQPLRVGAGSTTYQYDVTGLSAMTTITGTTHFIRLPEGTLLEERAPSGSYYYLTDGLGSVMAVVDSSGGVANRYSYDPYGNALSTSETVANPYRFDGQLLDQATGFYKMGARYYAPAVSRWTQMNLLPSFLANPQTFNLYSFTGNSPVNFIDPSGQDLVHDCLKGAAIGAIGGIITGGIAGAVASAFIPPALPVAASVGALSAGVGGFVGGCATAVAGDLIP